MSKSAVFVALVIGSLFWGCAGSTQTSSSQNGKQSRWYHNGNKAEELELKNGSKSGIYTTWYENGQMKLKCRFINDILHGEVISWFEDGKKRFIVHFDNGKRHGEWIRYHEKRNTIVASMNFVNDKLEGVLSAAYEQGNGNGTGRSFEIKSEFLNGELIHEFHFAYTNTDGHTLKAIGQISENGKPGMTREENITLANNGALKVNYGQYVKEFSSIQEFMITEINQHVVTKFSLDFCNGTENIWPCQFPKTGI